MQQQSDRGTLVRQSADEILDGCVAQWLSREHDWDAFGDGGNPGYQRMQVRYVGGGGSGKNTDAGVIPPGAFMITAMMIPPGQGTSVHSHSVDEAFFVLEGEPLAVVMDEKGQRATRRLGRWDCFCRPGGVAGGIYNDTPSPAYIQVILDSTGPIPVQRHQHGFEEMESPMFAALKGSGKN